MSPLRRRQMQVWLQRRIGLFLTALLVLAVAIQAYSWFKEFRRISNADRLLVAAENVKQPEAKPNGSPPAPPGQMEDIFKRQVVNYMLTGIIDDQALINNQWVQSGSRIQAATVVTVEKTSVTIQEDNKPGPRSLELFVGGGGGPGGPPPGRPGPMMRPGGPPPPPQGGGQPPTGSPRIRRGQIPRNAGLGRLDGMDIPQVMRGLRDGTIGIDEVPEQYRDRARRMLERGR